MYASCSVREKYDINLIQRYLGVVIEVFEIVQQVVRNRTPSDNAAKYATV